MEGSLAYGRFTFTSSFVCLGFIRNRRLFCSCGKPDQGTVGRRPRVLWAQGAVCGAGWRPAVRRPLGTGDTRGGQLDAGRAAAGAHWAAPPEAGAVSTADRPCVALRPRGAARARARVCAILLITARRAPSRGSSAPGQAARAPAPAWHPSRPHLREGSSGTASCCGPSAPALESPAQHARGWRPGPQAVTLSPSLRGARAAMRVRRQRPGRDGADQTPRTCRVPGASLHVVEAALSSARDARGNRGSEG